MSSLEFVKVKSRNDINLVAALAREIWTEYYTPIIGGAQVEYMLENFQSEAAIAKNLGEGYHYRYYILRLDGADVGYLAFTMENGGLFLSKIYIKKELRGSGLFAQTVDFLKGFCEKYDLFKIWLTVNRNNSGAIAAYESLGFKKEREQVTDIGGGFFMDDFVMIKNV